MINTYNSSHCGHLPIRVLQHNIIYQFEKTSPNFLEFSKKIIKELNLKDKISYDINKNNLEGHKVKGPYVKNKTSQIHIQESFLAYLWCMCFAIYTYTKTLNGDNKTSQEDIEKADKLMAYALKLKTSYVDWDKSKLLNPEQYDEEDKADIEAVNEIFIHAFNFVLCHELQHVAQGHVEKSKKGTLSTREKLENEQEADKTAIELIKDGYKQNKEESVNIGIVTALCSMVFFKGSVSNKTHPDSDIRIISALEDLAVEGNDITWVIACATFQLNLNLPDGMSAILDAESDTGVAIDEYKIWVECKRIKSIKKIESNVKKASTQLEKIMNRKKGSLHRGIVALDVSKTFHLGDMLLVKSNDEELILATQNIMDDFINNYARVWQKVYTRRHKNIIGVIIRFSFMCRSEERSLLVNASQWAINPRDNLSHNNQELLKKIVLKVSNS